MGALRTALALVPLLISAIFLLASQIAQPPASLRPRIFAIGLSKTGTTSIGDALEILGYRRLGWRDIRSRHMVHAWAHNDHDSLIALTHHYDAFEDLPWPLLYKEMAALYPDAKFILTLRQDANTWMRSMQRHVGRGKWEPYTYFYGADVFEGNEEIIRASYTNHTRNVRDYFREQPQRYMELNIDDGDANWPLLCEFTGHCPQGVPPIAGFPKANTAASWDMGMIPNLLQWCSGWIVTRTEEQCVKHYYGNGSTSTKAVLSSLWRMYNVIEQAYSELYFFVEPLVSRLLANRPTAKIGI